LGLEIHRDGGGCQQKYIHCLLDQYGITASRLAATPFYHRRLLGNMSWPNLWTVTFFGENISIRTQVCSTCPAPTNQAVAKLETVPGDDDQNIKCLTISPSHRHINPPMHSGWTCMGAVAKNTSSCYIVSKFSPKFFKNIFIIAKKKMDISPDYIL